MKLQHFTAFAFVLLGLTSLACSSPDDEIFMGNDDSGSGGSSAGAEEPDSNAGTGSAGKSQGGSASGGSSHEAGSSSGGTETGGTETGGRGGSASGGTGPTPWDPCAGKACGDVCQPCDPKDPTCVALAVEMNCSDTGQCSIGPVCTIPKCEGTQQYYAPGCDSLARPIGGGPFVPGCYDSCDPNGKACADGFTCTTVWHDPSANCLPGQPCIAACGAQASICIQN